MSNIDGILVDLVLAQHRLDDAHYSTVAVIRILAALQYASASCLETESEDVEGHIGASLIHYANDTKRHTDTLQVKTIRQDRMLEHTPERRRQGSHIARVASNALYALARQLESVIHRVGLVHAAEILGIGSQYSVCLLYGAFRHREEYAVDGLAIEERKFDACVFSGLKNRCQHRNSVQGVLSLSFMRFNNMSLRLPLAMMTLMPAAAVC